jgi:hypothetical protein
VKYQSILRTAEREARNKERGAWSACANRTEDNKESKQQTSNEACNIKGNISYEDKEKIYHVPGCEYYEQTVINEDKGERWFCSETEARNAGWRKARNCS